MRKSILSVFGLILFTIAGYSQTVYENFKDGELYFKLKDDVNISAQSDQSGYLDIEELPILLEFTDRYKFRSLRQPFYFTSFDKLKRTFQLTIADHQDIDRVIRDLQDHPFIDYAEKIPLNKLFYNPNDPALADGKQAYLTQIGAQQAWGHSRGSKNIIVGITDSGCDLEHPDLKPNLWKNMKELNGKAGVDDDGNGKIDDVNGWDFGDGDPDPSNQPKSIGGYEHGTHVTGLAGAISDNGQGLASIGFNVTLMHVKIFSSQGRLTDEYAAVAYAAENGARVINMSWGGPEYSVTNKNVIDYVHSKGVILVAAAGNGNSTVKNYPAAYDPVIAVAGVDQGDKKTSHSTYGSWISISAPGYIMLGLAPMVGGGTTNLGGTSQASPIVTGLCALMLSKNDLLTRDEVWNILKTTAVNIEGKNTSYKGMLGVGRIDAGAALAAVPSKNVPTLDAGITAVKYPVGELCGISSLKPKVTLKNYGSTTLTKVTISYQVDNGTTQNFNWTGNLVSQASEEITLNTITPGGGSHKLKVATKSPNAGTDGNTTNDQSTSNFSIPTPGRKLPFSETFEGAFPPAGWEISNPDNSLTWVKATTGNNSGSSAYINNFNYKDAHGQEDEFTMPALDLTGYSKVAFTFDIAYATYSPPEKNYSERLEVLVSTDCGKTFTSVYNKRGEDLTTGSFTEQDFVPAASQWRKESIDLSGFIGSDNVLIKFKQTCDWENNLYIDNISVDIGSSVTENFIIEETTLSVYPNPTNASSSVEIKLQKPSEVRLSILDMLGKEVLILENPKLDIGSHLLQIPDNAIVTPGVYLINLQIGHENLSRKLLVK